MLREMSAQTKCPLSARSRAPLDAVGASWWERFEGADETQIQNSPLNIQQSKNKTDITPGTRRLGKKLKLSKEQYNHRRNTDNSSYSNHAKLIQELKFFFEKDAQEIYENIYSSPETSKGLKDANGIHERNGREEFNIIGNLSEDHRDQSLAMSASEPPKAAVPRVTGTHILSQSINRSKLPENPPNILTVTGELSSELKRCRYPSDTGMGLACRGAICPRGKGGGWRGAASADASWAGGAGWRARAGHSIRRGPGTADTMPLLPARESAATPRSARAPTSARRPQPASFASHSLPHHRQKIEKTPEKPPPMDSPVGGSELRRQNEELRARLAGESADHRRRLDAYRRAQQGQAALVSRLQSKVLQYKQRCAELESNLAQSPRAELYRAPAAAIALPPPPHATAAAPSSSLSPSSAYERVHDLETALRRLDEEKRKCEKLVEQNTMLRDQLEESHQMNEALTNDLQKLTNDWETLREEMLYKEDEWKDEEQAFNDYYTTEHNRLLTVWREVVGVKRGFSELQASTERELYRARSELDSTARDLIGTLGGFSINAFAASQGYKPEPAQQAPSAAAAAAADQLRHEAREAAAQRDRALADLRERDARIQRLLAELQGLEERCEQAEAGCGEAGVMRAALEEVARALILDSEADAGGASLTPHLHPDRIGATVPDPVLPTFHPSSYIRASLRSPPPQPAKQSGAGGNILLSAFTTKDKPSPKRGVPQSANSTAFAESTISAVQAALHKYQLHIHELQVKLQNTREQLATNRKHCEAADANIASLENKVHDLQVKLDQATGDLNQLLQEKESMQKTIESLRSDKNNLERNRVEINAMVESLTSDYEKLQKTNSRLEKVTEVLEGEKRSLQGEVDRLQREGANREAVLRSEEERASRLRGELVASREELHKTALARDLLEQQKLESDALLSQMEKHRSDLEIDLERTILERGDLQDLADKLEATIRALEFDKKKLQEENKQLEDEKSAISSQSSDQLGDLNSLRKELLAAEQHRLELESDKASLHEKIKFLEGEREKVELDLRQVMRERGELSSQLTAVSRKRDALNEELIRQQQRLEQAGETNARLNRSLEQLVKEGEEKQIIIDTLDKEKSHLHEQLSALRSEKDALEAVLFDTSNLLEDADGKRCQLERELQETLVAQEQLKGQVARLNKDLETSERKMRETRNSLSQQSGKKEAEYQQMIGNLTRTSTENIRKLSEEKESLRQSLEQKLQQTVASLTSEKDASEAAARERERKLRASREALALQHDEAMLRAENEKQQALLMAHHEQQALMERLEEARRALDAEQGSLERLKREAQARADHDRAAANQLKDELATLRTRLEECKASAEDDCARFETRIKELLLEREACARECQDVRSQLQVAEDKQDNLTSQLNDTLRKLKELENESESLRKELTDARRQLTACTAERDKYSASCRELREHVKRAEHERRETARALDEAYHKIAGLEEVRSSLDSERSRLQGLLKEAETGSEHLAREARATEAQLKRERAALEQMQGEAKEMQARLQNESEERERCGGEAGAARRHAAELEALLAAARADLQAARQRGAELEEGCRARDQELVLRLEDCRSKERRLEELKHNLEVCLADATQQIQELKARLGGCEGRGRALEASLASCEAGRRDAEARLSSVAHALRRVAGVQPDGTVQGQARQRRLTSPARRYSPHRGREHSEERGELIDVDPELIKKGIRSLMHDVAQIEREKVLNVIDDSRLRQEEYKAQVCSMRKQLKQCTEQQGKGEGRLQQVASSLRSVQEEKARVQAALAQKEAQLNQQNEVVQIKTVEINNLRDKITSLEASLSSVTDEKGQNEDKCGKLHALLSEREGEVCSLREALAASEARAARLDVRRAQLEGDLQRASVAARERDSALQKLQERCDAYARAAASLEDRCTSLKGTVEQLSASLQKAAAAESELRAELARLQRHLAEARQGEGGAHEKLRQAQKALAGCESERRVVAEKLESARQAAAEYKRLNASLEDQVHRLNNQLANVEVQRSGLESQLRLTAWDGKESVDSDIERELHAVQRERSELKAKVDSLQDAVRRLEAEKRTRPALRSKSHERGDKSVYCSDLDGSGAESAKERYRDSNLGSARERGFSAEMSLLEVENRELRMKIRRMEKELADKEAELSLARSRFTQELSSTAGGRDEAERYRQAALQSERLMEAREASHRQQLLRLENQAAQLRAQLAAEIRRRQTYIARSGRAARDVQRLRSALGDSLRTVSQQEPALDSYMLEHEARKLDSTLAHSLPPLNDSYDSSK